MSALKEVPGTALLQLNKNVTTTSFFLFKTFVQKLKAFDLSNNSILVTDKRRTENMSSQSGTSSPDRVVCFCHEEALSIC